MLRKLVRFTNGQDVARDMVVRSDGVALAASLAHRTVPSMITPNNHPQNALFKPRSRLRSKTARLEAQQDDSLALLYRGPVFSIRIFRQLHYIVGFPKEQRLYALDHAPEEKRANCLAQLNSPFVNPNNPSPLSTTDKVAICNIVTLRHIGGGQKSRFCAILVAPLLPQANGGPLLEAYIARAQWYSANGAPGLISKILVGSTYRCETAPIARHYFTPWTSTVDQLDAY